MVGVLNTRSSSPDLRPGWDIVYGLLERLSMTFTANGKNETFAVSLQLCVQ